MPERGEGSPCRPSPRRAARWIQWRPVLGALLPGTRRRRSIRHELTASASGAKRNRRKKHYIGERKFSKFIKIAYEKSKVVQRAGFCAKLWCRRLPQAQHGETRLPRIMAKEWCSHHAGMDAANGAMSRD